MARKKDRPLLLRRRRDGMLLLESDSFPPRHEFSKEWLLENTMSGTVAVSPDRIEVRLANARAIYRIDRSLMEATDEEGRVRTLATGYWGVLESEESIKPPPVDEERAAALLAEAEERRRQEALAAARALIAQGEVKPRG